MVISEKDKIIVALDVPTKKEALNLVSQLKGHVGMFKVGLELLNSVGIDVVRGISQIDGKVFLDGKFNDIPNTVERTSRAVTRLGVTMFNVHALGGRKMLESAIKGAKEEASSLAISRPLVLGVTILTSIGNNTMNKDLKIPGTVESQVVHLALLSESSGLDGVIASPQEATAIRRAAPNMLIVTPGVRPKWASVNDQKRVLTPGEAISKGASYVVIGRPITRPPSQIGSPVDAAKKIAEEMHIALSSGD